MHRSQMLPSERARARAAKRDHGGVVGKGGVISLFHNSAATAAAEAEQRSSTQWNTGVEENVDNHHCGANFQKLWDE